MNTLILQTISITTSAFLAAAMLIPWLSRQSQKIGLTDEPSARKLHQGSIPIVGGLAMFMALSFAIFLNPLAAEFVKEHWVAALAAISIFIMALLDDRLDLPALWRLSLQFAAAIAVAHSGLRLESLHGFLGIEALPLSMQYFLTILVIVGTTNAFNLMDGLDGLLGNLTFVNFSVLSVIAFASGQYGLGMITAAVAATLLAFLRKNSFPAVIYMGDGGSMTLGFLNAVIGIFLLKVGGPFEASEMHFTLIAGTLFLPVMDALRVFAHRFANGGSIFSADRTHLHHLVLQLGWNPGQIAYSIAGYHFMIVLLVAVLAQVWDITTVFILLIVLQLLVSKLLTFNSAVANWRLKIQKVENNGLRT